MRKSRSFRTRLFVSFLLASLVPLLLCSTMPLQIFRLRMDRQADADSQEQLDHVVEALDGLPAHKMHCSVLAEEAIKAALADYYTRQGLPVPPECAVPAVGESCPHCG